MLDGALNQSRWIYGLFAADGTCAYVGQTRALWSREFNHRSVGHNKDRRFTFRVIRKTTSEHANRLEGQIISAFWRKSQCRLNKVKRGHCQRPIFSIHCKPLYWVEKKYVFPSISEAARYFDCSVCTLKNWMSHKSSFPTGITLKKVSDL